MAKITIVDIQHKEFKKSLQGYDRNEVNEFLDEIIETLEDEAQTRAALQGEIADLRERLSHFKAMEESLQSTLLLAQRTADEVKAAAHKEADLIKQEARLAARARDLHARRPHRRVAARSAAASGHGGEGEERAALAADVAPRDPRAHAGGDAAIRSGCRRDERAGDAERIRRKRRNGRAGAVAARQRLAATQDRRVARRASWSLILLSMPVRPA